MLSYKTLNFQSCDIKSSDDGGSFAGYASVFGGVDTYGDTIAKGAYQKSLKEHGMPKVFINHDDRYLPVGKALAREDDKGLMVDIELTPGMAAANDARAALKHQTIDGLSIGYMLKRSDYETLDDGTRLIKNISRLYEVSIVTYPADSAARIDLASVKSEGLDEVKTIKDFEYFLRDAGNMSRELAKAVISQAKIVLNPRDVDADEAKKMLEIEARIKRIAKNF